MAGQHQDAVWISFFRKPFGESGVQSATRRDLEQDPFEDAEREERPS